MTSLAVRHRPRRFADVVGQRHAVAVLRGAVRSGQVPQQLLLFGGSGLGKTTLARLLAAALLCQSPVDGDACGDCDSCRDIHDPGRVHPDLVELDAASNGGKDEIRALAERAHLAPLRSRWRMYVVDEAHGLSGPGAQAFLKLLEEPPAHVLFALATTDPEKLPATLRGRTLQLQMRPPTPAELGANLDRIAAAEGWSLPAGTVEQIVAASDPALGVRGTVMMLERLEPALATGAPLDTDTVSGLLDVVDPRTVAAVTDAIEYGDRPGALSALDTALLTCPQGVVRAGLQGWARRGLGEALASGDPEGTWVWRLRTLLACPDDPDWLTVTVAGLAAPQLTGDPDAVAALLRDAEQTLTRLHAAATADTRPSLARGGDAPARANTPAPAATVTVQVPAPADLAAAVASDRPEAGRLLAYCRVQPDPRNPAGLIVGVPAQVVELARAHDLPGSVLQAADRLGVPVRFARLA